MQVYSIEGTSSSTVVVISNLGKVREIIAALDTIVVGSVAVNLYLIVIVIVVSPALLDDNNIFVGDMVVVVVVVVVLSAVI